MTRSKVDYSTSSSHSTMRRRSWAEAGVVADYETLNRRAVDTADDLLTLAAVRESIGRQTRGSSKHYVASYPKSVQRNLWCTCGSDATTPPEFAHACISVFESSAMSATVSFSLCRFLADMSPTYANGVMLHPRLHHRPLTFDVLSADNVTAIEWRRMNVNS